MKSKLYYITLLGILGWAMTTGETCFAAKFQTIDKHYPIDPQKTLIVSVAVDAGQVKISANEKLGEIHVWIEYDDRYDQIEINHNKGINEFFIAIDREDWLKSIEDDRAPKLSMALPTDVVIMLDSKIMAGEVKFELGDLRLKDFRLKNSAGEVKVDFPTPNQIEMELLEIDVKIGETRLRRLGNARFHQARINGGIGELNIDFSGQGCTSARADIDLDIGATTIYLPRELGVRFDSATFGFLTQKQIDFDFEKKGRFYYSPGYGSSAQRLDCSISAGIGELRVVYR
ncbi:MAG: cell wall-active antibiotics response protein [candidate division KSB1 bacterium]|nr:cell wall-active antibiotics response protein [candidate division KSB1 bacterium]